MKKIIFSMVGSLFIFMIIWTAIFFKEYTINDIPYVHLDLEGMFTRFKISWSSYNIYDLWKEILKTTNKIGSYTPVAKAADFLLKSYNAPQYENDIVKFVINAFSVIIDPIFGILYSAIVLLNTFRIVVVIIGTIADVILQCLGFVFNPLFIDTRITDII